MLAGNLPVRLRPALTSAALASETALCKCKLPRRALVRGVLSPDSCLRACTQANLHEGWASLKCACGRVAQVFSVSWAVDKVWSRSCALLDLCPLCTTEVPPWLWVLSLPCSLRHARPCVNEMVT